MKTPAARLILSVILLIMAAASLIFACTRTKLSKNVQKIFVAAEWVTESLMTALKLKELNAPDKTDTNEGNV